jgi:hypothetical protein
MARAELSDNCARVAMRRPRALITPFVGGLIVWKLKLAQTMATRKQVSL